MIFRSERRFRAAQRMGRMAETPLVRKDGQGVGWIGWLPGLLGGWTQVRDLQEMPKETFRELVGEARGRMATEMTTVVGFGVGEGGDVAADSRG